MQQKIDFKDYMRGKFSDSDIMTYNDDGRCMPVDYVNVRGYTASGTTAKFYQRKDSHFVHIVSASPGCAFHASGADSSEDNFGYYGIINKNFRCTTTDDSTTQWWFGGYMADWTIQLVVNYMLKMYMPFGSILDLNTDKGNIIFSLI